MYSPSGHPRCRWVCFFIRTDLEKFSSELHYLLTNGSSAVNGMLSEVKIVLNKDGSGFWCERKTGDGMFTVYYELWTILAISDCQIKCICWCICLNMQLFTSQDVNWWTGKCGVLVDYCDVCISCLDSHSDGTHSLQRIHWWTSNAKSPNLIRWKKNTLIYILDGQRVSTFSANFQFWVNYSFKKNITSQYKSFWFWPEIWPEEMMFLSTTNAPQATPVKAKPACQDKKHITDAWLYYCLQGS